jgi:hypothetical protein
VIPLRHPLEVAASLEKRNGFPTAQSLLLWLQHMLALERDTRGLKRTFFNYEKLLCDPRRVCNKIALDLGLQWPRSWEDARAEIETFLSKNFKHHSFDSDPTIFQHRPPQWIGTVFDWTIRATKDPRPTPDELDRISATAQIAGEIYLPLIAFYKRELQQAQQKIQDLKIESDRVQTISRNHFSFALFLFSSTWKRLTAFFHATVA